MNDGLSLHFDELCNVFTRLRETTRPNKKRDILSEFIQNYKNSVSALSNSNTPPDTSCYPILRLLLPNLDHNRGAYGIKAVKFAKIISRILCLPPQGSEALQLINFRATDSSKIADFGDAAYWILRRRFTKRKQLSITEVNLYLDKIAQKNVDNDPRGLEQEMLNLFTACGHAEDLKWIIRLILKDLRLGIGQDSILNIFHPDAAQLYTHANDLKKVCEVLTNPNQRLHEIEVSVFTPFRPMLSRRCDAKELSKKIRDPCHYFIETKFDGERFQLHMKNGLFRYFSRNGYDYTDTYGESYMQGLYTPLLNGVFSAEVKSIILDGEMMGYNKAKKQFGSKGMNFDVKTLKHDSQHQPCLCVFDILLLNEKVLTNIPLQTRLNMLKGIISPKEGTLMISQIAEAYCKQDILDALNMSADHQEEGIVFKDLNSIYKPHERNSGWWKLKLEYFEGAITDLDVIILGGYYGEGRLRTKISGFLVGILVSHENGSQAERKFVSLSRVASGLSDRELSQIDQKLGKYWNLKNHEHAKKYGIMWGKEIPDVWIKPEDTCVLTVRASELTKTHSREFTADYTLRFPRILKIRDDKPYYDCLTTAELKDITYGNKPVEKLTKCHITMEDIENSQNTRKVRKRKYQAPELAIVEKKTDILKGLECFVLSGTKEWCIQGIQKAIQENGGEIVLTEGANTSCILVGDEHPRVTFLKDTKANMDIVKIEWLKRVLENGVFTEYKPNDAVHLSKKSTLRYKQLYDKYKDSYAELTAEQTLPEIFIEVECSGDYINPLKSEIKHLKLSHPYLLFKEYVAYFDKHKVINNPATSEIYNCFVDEMEFRFYGGCISNMLNQNVNLVILKTENRNEDVSLYLNLIRNFSCKIVTRDFIQDSIQKYNLT